MTIMYCDWLNGDDKDDGSYTTPYKTILKASTGLTGGDEVRCAKSPDESTLSGTLAFVNNSTSITTSVDLTGVLNAGDFIYKSIDSNNMVEVISLTTTTLTLYKAYRGTTETVTAKKLGITSTGSSAQTTTNIQEIMSSGLSATSKLKISGGWDLTTQTQTGYTNFRQMNSTFNNRYGRGLYGNTKNYLELEKLKFLRYYYGIFIEDSHNIEFTSITNNGNAYRGIDLNNVTETHGNIILTSVILNENNDGIFLNKRSYNTINTLTCNNNTQHGIIMHNMNVSIINTLTCNNNTQQGIEFSYFDENILYLTTCNNNGTNGIYLGYADNNIINSLTCNNNTQYGIKSDKSYSNVINDYAGTGNTSGDIDLISDYLCLENPVLNMQHFKTTGDNRCYYLSGITYRDTTEARSTQCLRYTTSSDIYYIKHAFHFQVSNGVGKGITFYIKDDSSFNGDVQAALYFMGKKITGWTTITSTTSYIQKTITAQAADITEDGIIELHIKVKGTTGNIYLDDLGMV